ncbi:MAG: patatin-like phospholipase family protein, partial [Acidobacteriaceae bacterium]|nr:patatin-like phospholipase family protein [Acidobacteriaceae bacterium]
MEPISELATRITSHLWLLHDLYPDQESVSAILSEKYWPGDLERSAASDWSLLQLVLDLVSDSLNGESGAFGSESEPESLLRRIFHWKSEKARSKNAEETATPGKLASRAVEAMAQRMSTVQEQHLDCDLTFAATCPASALQNAGQLSPSKLLTREELFQNVANSLLRRKVSELHMLADAFLGKAQFLMEEEIDRCAKAIMEKAGKQTAAKTAADWSQKSKPEQRKLVLNRIELRCLCKQLAVPVPFSIVLSDELDEIARSRLVRLYGQEADPSSPPPAVEARDKCGIPSKLAVASQQGFESSLFGLALSGGGVRSATFALGLLQGMADRNLLPYIDILSTVSGGGYIGSWLISWIKRRGGIDVVQQSLRGSASLLTLGQDCPERRPANAGPNLSQPLQWVSRNSDPHSDHVRPVRLLRDYSRYLTPQAGFFSADSWTMAATWFRNTTLNLVVLALFFGAALLFPRFPILLLQYLGNKVENIVGPNPSAWKLLRTTFLTTFLASLPLLVSLIFIRWNLNTLWRALQGDRRASPGDSETWVLLKTLPCIWLGAFLELVVLWSSVHSEIAPWLVTACFVSPLALEVG